MRASGKRKNAGRRRMAGSLNRLKRKGCTASSRSGPPKFISTTAVRVISGADWLGEKTAEHLHVFRRRFRQHAMAEIEDIGPLAEHPTEPPHSFFESSSSGNQQDGIEITLNRPIGLQISVRVTSRNRRIDVDPGDPGLVKIVFVQHPGAAWETDDRAIRAP